MTERRSGSDGPDRPDRSHRPGRPARPVDPWADGPAGPWRRPVDPPAVHLGGPAERSVPGGADPVGQVLRARLDRELAPLAATAQARRRLLAAAARGRSGRRSRARIGARPGRSRWAVPVVAAAMAVTVAAVPVAAARWWRDSRPPVRSGTVPVQPAAPPGPSPTTAPPSPSPVVRAAVRIVLRPAVTRMPVGKPLTVVLSWAPGQLPATAATSTPGPSVDPVPATTAARTASVPGMPQAVAPAVPTGATEPARRAAEARALAQLSAAAGRQTSWLMVSWGDGQQGKEAVSCVDGKALAPAQLPLRHTYRAPGPYRISVLPAVPLACPAQVLGGQAEVVIF